ncbi:MAG: hypothetical protein CMJ32_05365 [Phycisphaerae bacterium]|nr:hypothetical protein [Phycisphaerae bacterium]
MPELPEVEHLRKSLARGILGAKVAQIHIQRADFIDSTASSPRAGRRSSLMNGGTISGLYRHGKQLVIQCDDGRCVCIHLGMSGRLFLRKSWSPPEELHCHCSWLLRRNGTRMRLDHMDPRRFGGIWTFPSMDSVIEHRWNRLGVDALDLEESDLHDRMSSSTRPVKTLLLDQTKVAGLGNIYVDEALFKSGIHPLTPSKQLSQDKSILLRNSILTTLKRALKAGGSTLRDYRDPAGRSGSFQYQHDVYARGGLPCRKCGALLDEIQVSGRTTTFCCTCQPRKLS